MRVSRSTLRRDLLELEERGHIVRVHGGVVHRDFLNGEPTFDRRGKQAVEAKRAIGAKAAERIGENTSVYVDAGTTCIEVGRHAMPRADIKLFTHSLRLASDAASANAAASVVLVGGEVRNLSHALVGGLSLEWLKQLRFDIAFIAASGVDAEGLSTTELSEAAVKQAIIERSKQVVLVADSTKWDRPAAVRFADWKRINTWVVDPALSKSAGEIVGQAGVEIEIAKEGK